MLPQTPPAAERPPEDLLLEASYRAEFASVPSDRDAVQIVAGQRRRGGELRAIAVSDLAARVADHGLLRRTDDTARIMALQFVERRLSAANKPAAYDGSGAFAGFLRRVIHNLLLDWLRSPAGRAEVRRASHEPGGAFDRSGEDEPALPSEEAAQRQRLALYHLVALRALRGTLPPGRSVVLRLSLWPHFPMEAEDRRDAAAFAHCHETAVTQGEARGCDGGKRCTTPDDAWRAAWEGELAEAEGSSPSGLSRRAIAMLTRIGAEKSLSKREGAICERISKGRMQLVAALRRSGITSASGAEAGGLS